MVDRIRASPVVYFDETGWCQDGDNGYAWTPCRGWDCAGCLMHTALGARSSCCGAGTRKWRMKRHGDGVAGSIGQQLLCRLPPLRRSQCSVCWIGTYLRDIHDLKALYPKDQGR